jgi:hypothetical protein
MFVENCVEKWKRKFALLFKLLVGEQWRRNYLFWILLDMFPLSLILNIFPFLTDSSPFEL